MVAFTQSLVFTCSRCSIRLEVSMYPVVRVSGDTTDRAPTTVAWCVDEARPVLAEDVSSLDELHESRTELLELWRTTPEGMVVDLPTPASMDTLIAWRQRRVGPARCLECGSTRIRNATWEADGRVTLPHEGCGMLTSMGLRYQEWSEPPPPWLVDDEGNRSR